MAKYAKSAPHARRPGAATGFSLIEVIAVVAITAILAVAVVPAASSGLRAVNLGGLAQRMADEFNLARQVAIARNRSVELRFYEEPDGQYGREFRRTAIVVPGSPSEWLTNAREFPAGIIVDQNGSFSPLTGADRFSESPDAPGGARGKQFFAIRFLPDGTVEVDGLAANPENLVVSFRDRKSEPRSGRPADNFVAFVLDAQTGRSTVFQP